MQTFGFEKIPGLIRHTTTARLTGLEILKYIGPGLLVTVGLIDPGNWASNIAAGSQFGYSLLWVVTLSTAMLIFLQHNPAGPALPTRFTRSFAIGSFFFMVPDAELKEVSALGAKSN